MASFLHDPEMANQRLSHEIPSSDSAQTNYAVAAIPIADSRSSSYAPLHFELSEDAQTNGASNLNKISTGWRYFSLFLITIAFILLFPAVIQPHWADSSFQIQNIVEMNLNIGLWSMCARTRVFVYGHPMDQQVCTHFTSEMLQDCFNKQSNTIFHIGGPPRGSLYMPNVTDSEALFCGLMVTSRGFSTTAVILSGLATSAAGILAYLTFKRAIAPRTMFYHKCFMGLLGFSCIIAQIGLITGIYTMTTAINEMDSSAKTLKTEFSADYSITLYSLGLSSLFIGSISHVFLFRKIQRALIADTNPNGMDGYIN